MGSARADGRGGTQTLTSIEAPKKENSERHMPVPCKAAVKHCCRKRPCAVPHISRPNNRSPIGREAAPCNKFLPPKPKNFPQEHPPQAKRINLSPCKGGCCWGKFGEDEGGLEGEGTPSERGFLLPPRSFPHPSLRRMIRGCDKAGVSLLHFRASRRILFGVAEPETDCNRRVHLVHHALVEMSHLFA